MAMCTRLLALVAGGKGGGSEGLRGVPGYFLVRTLRARDDAVETWRVQARPCAGCGVMSVEWVE